MSPLPPYTLAQLLPHGSGFILLDELLEYGEHHAACAINISERSLLFEPGRGVPAWVAVEYLAQTVAVFGGALRRQRGLPVQIGLLLGARSCEIGCDYFTAGQRLIARASELLRDESGVGAYNCELFDGETRRVKAEIKAYQPEDITGYLQTLGRVHA